MKGGKVMESLTKEEAALLRNAEKFDENKFINKIIHPKGNNFLLLFLVI